MEDILKLKKVEQYSETCYTWFWQYESLTIKFGTSYSVHIHSQTPTWCKYRGSDDGVETNKQIRIKESIVVALKAIFWSNTYWFLFQKSDLTNSRSCCQRQLDNSKVQKRFSMAAESSWSTVTRVNSADRGTSSSIVTVICLDNEANDTAILWGCIWWVKMLQHCYEHGLECFFSILNIYLYMQYNIFNYIKIKYMNILNIKD